MIASVRGAVLSIALDRVVVEVGGVGLAVRATPATLATLTRGQDAYLATTLVVREDSLTLFGFGSDEARDLFELVQSVTGVGPKIALALLAVFSPDELRQTYIAQPAIFCVSVAALRALEAAGVPRPAFVAGHSLGEFSALVAAGALSFEAGLLLVARRAEAMQRAADARPGVGVPSWFRIRSAA